MISHGYAHDKKIAQNNEIVNLVCNSVMQRTMLLNT